tara:strand:- start:1143 stop:2381 length:1239 start_codon:yes stop_codon:yes gene_type:complete
MKIESKEQIINYFISGNKNEQLIGVENEKFLFKTNSNKRAEYSDLLKIFTIFIDRFDWQPIKEDNNIIGLKKNGKAITLEPGNQIELSGEKLTNIHEVCAESFEFQDKLNLASKEVNLKTLSVGYDPFSNLDNIPNNPKKRYRVMTKEMPRNGKLSLDMMYLTAGTQINIDYKSEDDFKKKFKVISYLTPLSIGLFSNSAIKENKFSGFLSYRSKVWQNTSRGGLPEIFLNNISFEMYADFILNFPLLFLKKKNEYLFPEGKTYSDLIEEGLADEKNLELHLSTIFTEVRLKKYIEIRSLDACEWNCHCAGPAFFVGLLYGNIDEVYQIVKDWNKNEIMNAYFESPKKGLQTEIKGKSFLEWGKIFLDLSKESLLNRNFKNKNNNDESIFLKNIEQIIKEKKTKAEKTLEQC